MPTRRIAGGTRGSSAQIGRALFALYCVDAAFDFRSKLEAGNGIQVVLAVFSCLAFTLFALNARETKNSLPRLRRVAWTWWVYLATTPVIAYMRGVPAAHFLRIVLPLILMGTSLMMGYILLNESKANAPLIFKGLFYSSLCSGIVHLIQGVSTGRGLDDVRYYIASPLLILMVSFTLYRLLIEGLKSGLLNLIALVSGMLIIFFSVTRTYLVSLGAIVLAIGLILFRPPKWLKGDRRREVFRNLVLISLVLGTLSVVIVVVFPSVIQHWSARSSSLGTHDPTALTRIAEAAGELEAMTVDASHLLLGSGIGSEHKFDERYLIGVAEVAHEGEESNYAPGHIGWVYQFYVSGLLLGWVYPFILIVAIWKGNSPSSPYLARLAGVALIAVFVTSFFGNVLGDRAGGIAVGLLMALSLYGAESPVKVRGVRRISGRNIDSKPIRPVVSLSGNLDSAREN